MVTCTYVSNAEPNGKRKKVNGKTASPSHLDPTRTGGLRNSLISELTKRFNRLKQLTTKLLVDEDALGLKATSGRFIDMMQFPGTAALPSSVTTNSIDPLVQWIEEQAAILNCGGKGGKPGPCPEGERPDQPKPGVAGAPKPPDPAQLVKQVPALANVSNGVKAVMGKVMENLTARYGLGAARTVMEKSGIMRANPPSGDPAGTLIWSTVKESLNEVMGVQPKLPPKPPTANQANGKRPSPNGKPTDGKLDRLGKAVSTVFGRLVQRLAEDNVTAVREAIDRNPELTGAAQGGAVTNAFCPTGEGGGQDNRCASRKGVGRNKSKPVPTNKVKRMMKARYKIDRDPFDDGECGSVARALELLNPDFKPYAVLLGDTEQGEGKGIFHLLVSDDGGKTFVDGRGPRTRESVLRSFDKNDKPEITPAKYHKDPESRYGGFYTAENSGEEFEAGANEMIMSLFKRGKGRPTANTRWADRAAPEKLKAFGDWIRVQLGGEFTKLADEELWRAYAEAGMRKGASRAFDDVSKAQRAAAGANKEKLSFYDGTKDQFLRDSFTQPVSVDRIKVLATRSFEEMRGLTNGLVSRMIRTLADGLVQGLSARKIAKKLSAEIDVTKERASVIARTEIIRAHADGQLMSMRRLGVESVGIAVEWAVARDRAGNPDDRVCKLCRPLDGIVLTLDEAEGLIPRHPRCRCAFIPANVGEVPTNRKTTKSAIDAAIDTSLGRDTRSESTVSDEGGEWAGETKRIKKRRPKPLLNSETKGLSFRTLNNHPSGLPTDLVKFSQLSIELNAAYSAMKSREDAQAVNDEPTDNIESAEDFSPLPAPTPPPVEKVPEDLAEFSRIVSGPVERGVDERLRAIQLETDYASSEPEEEVEEVQEEPEEKIPEALAEYSRIINSPPTDNCGGKGGKPGPCPEPCERDDSGRCVEEEKPKRGKKTSKSKAPPLPKNLEITMGDDVQERLKKLNLSPEQVAALSSASNGSKVDISTLSSDMLYVKVNNPDYEARRIISGRDTIVNDSFHAKKTGTGLGTDVFASQVAHAASLGYKTIDTHAARGLDMNGYYTWPRLGYDYAFGKDDPIRESYPGANSLSDIMKTKEGRDLWKKNGDSIDLTFDLTEGSLSRKVLSAYVKESLAKRKKAGVTTNAEPLRSRWEEPPDVDDDLLDSIWDDLEGMRLHTNRTQIDPVVMEFSRMVNVPSTSPVRSLTEGELWDWSSDDFSPTDNAFCSTGEGGGIDPTCSEGKGVSKRTKKGKGKGKALTREERGMLDSYNGSWYQAVNSGLRSGKLIPLTDSEAKVMEEAATYSRFGEGDRIGLDVARERGKTFEYMTGRIDSALSKSQLPEDMTLYRGVSFKSKKEDFLSKAEPGSVIADKAYLSTSSSAESAERFASGEDSGPIQYVMHINVPKGTNAVDMGQTGIFQQNLVGGEREFLLGRGNKLKIRKVKRKKDGGPNIVYADLIGPGPTTNATTYVHFRDCDRDDKGRCLPGRGSGGSGSIKESKRRIRYKPNVTEDPNRDGITDAARVGVPAEVVPPPPPVPRLPNLTPKERKAEREFIRHYEADPDGVSRAFREDILIATRAGEAPTFGTDDAKLIAKQWNGDDLGKRSKNRATLNVALHQTANAIAKRAFLQHLDSLQKGDEIMVTVGGCGAGKGYAISGRDKVTNQPLVPEAFAIKQRVKAVWDSAGDQNATENPWIQAEAEKRGLKVNYLFVHADPYKNWADPERGVIKRAGDPKDGRMVDAQVFADSYSVGVRNHHRFYMKNVSNPNAKFMFLENIGKPRLIRGIPREALKYNRKRLARFANAAAQRADAPEHVKTGATIGNRIWGEP